MTEQYRSRTNPLRQMGIATNRSADDLWDLQQKMLGLYRDYAVHWIERRRQDAEAALETTQELMGWEGKSTDIMGIYGKYLTGSLKRVMDDVGEYTKCQNECAVFLQDKYVQSSEEMASQAAQMQENIGGGQSAPNPQQRGSGPQSARGREGGGSGNNERSGDMKGQQGNREERS